MLTVTFFNLVREYY